MRQNGEIPTSDLEIGRGDATQHGPAPARFQIWTPHGAVERHVQDEPTRPHAALVRTHEGARADRISRDRVHIEGGPSERRPVGRESEAIDGHTNRLGGDDVVLSKGRHCQPKPAMVDEREARARQIAEHARPAALLLPLAPKRA